MVHGKHVHLTRRERQIMDVLYRSEEASVGEIQAQIPNSPSYSAVRALVGKLLDKGHVEHRQVGAKYLYRPILPKADARQSAITRLINTFFNGSGASAVVNLLGQEARDLSAADIEQIEAELARIKAAKGPE
ncbi:MAG: BlaI/MecI/CopY family transcriptional regulator [Pseudomonadota bacterium]